MKFKFLATLTLSIIVTHSFSQVKNAGYTRDFFEKASQLAIVPIGENAIYISSDMETIDLSCTSKSLQKKWSKSVKGYLHYANQLGKNIALVVSTAKTDFTGPNSEYKGYLIDASTGAVLKEKILFTGNNEYFTLVYPLNLKDKKTLSFATRETGLTRTVKVGLGAIGAMYSIKKMDKQANALRYFNVMTFDQSLEQIQKLSPVLPDGDFVGVQKTINSDLYVAVADNRAGVTISRYPAGKETLDKSVKEAYSVYGGLLGIDHLSDAVKLVADTINNNTVYLTGSFKSDDEYITVFNKYDFAEGKHKKFTKSFTKADVKALEKSYVPVNKEFKKINIGYPRNIELVALNYDADGYFLALSDRSMSAVTPQTPNAHAYSQGIICYILDKDLKEKNTVLIPRAVGSPFANASAFSYRKGNALYLFAGHDNQGGFVTAKMNLTNGSLESLAYTEPEKTDKNEYPLLPVAIVTGSTLTLPILDFKQQLMQMKVKYDVHLYQFTIE